MAAKGERHGHAMMRLRCILGLTLCPEDMFAITWSWYEMEKRYNLGTMQCKKKNKFRTTSRRQEKGRVVEILELGRSQDVM